MENILKVRKIVYTFTNVVYVVGRVDFFRNIARVFFHAQKNIDSNSSAKIKVHKVSPGNQRLLSSSDYADEFATNCKQKF